MRTAIKTTNTRQTPLKWEEKCFLIFSILPPLWSSDTQQGPVPALCGHSTSEAVLRTGSPLCKDIWATLIIKAQRNASPTVSPGIKTKQLPRTYQLPCWFRPAQVTVVLFVNRGLAGRGAGRKCNLLHLVAENREYN